MKQTGRESGIDFTDQKVLDSDATVLSLARRTAFYKISLESQKTEHSCVGIHACFRWRGVLLEGLAYREVLEFPGNNFLTWWTTSRMSSRGSRPTRSGAGCRRRVAMDGEEDSHRTSAKLCNKPFYVVLASRVRAFSTLLCDKKKFYSLSHHRLEHQPEEMDKIVRGLTAAQQLLVSTLCHQGHESGPRMEANVQMPGSRISTRG